jgi:pimeloyl-ACP methyl ester carboxylesterase
MVDSFFWSLYRLKIPATVRFDIMTGSWSLSLELADGSIVTGSTFLKLKPTVKLSSPAIPLVVLVHGGSCNSDYFDIDEEHTVRHFTEVLGIPAIALNRPGYGGTTSLPSPPAGNTETYIQRHGRWLHELALPAVWKEFSKALNVSSVVLYGVSVGGGVAIVAAGLAGRTTMAYKLSGLALSALGSIPDTGPMSRFFGDQYAITGKVIEIPHEFREKQSAGSNAALFNTSVFRSRRGEANTTDEEVYDINIQWPKYYASYAKNVGVQVLYSVGNVDTLWHLNADTVNGFGQAFANSPWVETRLMDNAPHAVEYSYQCSGLLLRVFGFALECAASLAIQEEKEKLHSNGTARV